MDKVDLENEIKASKPTKALVKRVPWKKANMLEIPNKYKNPNLAYRWGSETDKNMMKKFSEGWKRDTEVLKKMIADGYGYVPTVEDGKSTDGSLRVRELVLLCIPKERVEAREEYYKDLNARRMAALKKKPLTGNKEFDKRSYLKDHEIEIEERGE